MSDPTTLARRSIPELIQSLRERALRLCGAAWEVPATQAMMNEAADRLAELDAAGRVSASPQREDRNFDLADRLGVAADNCKNVELARLLREAEHNVRWADPEHTSTSNNAYGGKAARASDPPPPETPTQFSTSFLEHVVRCTSQYEYDSLVRDMATELLAARGSSPATPPKE